MFYEIMLLVFSIVIAYFALSRYVEAVYEVGPHRWSMIVSLIVGLFFGVAMVIAQGWLRGLETGILFFSLVLITIEKGKLARFRRMEKLKQMSDEYPEIAEFFSRRLLTRRTIKKVRDQKSKEDSGS